MAGAGRDRALAPSICPSSRRSTSTRPARPPRTAHPLPRAARRQRATCRTARRRASPPASMTEAIVWFAWHRREDRDARLYDDERRPRDRRRVRLRARFVGAAASDHYRDARLRRAARSGRRPRPLALTRVDLRRSRPAWSHSRWPWRPAVRLSTATSCTSSPAPRHLAWGYVDQPPFVPAVARTVGRPLRHFGRRHSASSRPSPGASPSCSRAAWHASSAAVAAPSSSPRSPPPRRHRCSPPCTCCRPRRSTCSSGRRSRSWSLRLLRTGDERWWLAIGAVTGFGLLNKYNVAFLLVGLAVGLIGSGRAHGSASR